MKVLELRGMSVTPPESQSSNVTHFQVSTDLTPRTTGTGLQCCIAQGSLVHGETCCICSEIPLPLLHEIISNQSHRSCL